MAKCKECGKQGNTYSARRNLGEWKVIVWCPDHLKQALESGFVIRERPPKRVINRVDF